MTHIILGLFLIALGIWGLFDEWHYVMDISKGLLPLIMTAMGVLSLALFFVGPQNLKKEK
ncbi:MAG: hypothetical protein HQM16_12215 [Deltaproteobacteria bacterium]|nr:hypothetical protein [Deltaproteobacteria bacterium]